MKVKPLGDNVIISIKKKDSAQKTESGIILPESSIQEKAQDIGSVMAIGNKVEHIKKGDQVLFKNYTADELSIDDEEVLVINQENIIAILEK